MSAPVIRYYCLNCDFETVAYELLGRPSAYTEAMIHARENVHLIDWEQN